VNGDPEKVESAAVIWKAGQKEELKSSSDGY